MIQFIPKGPWIPENIYQALANDSLVLFCGAGVSKAGAGLPLFPELTEKICKELPNIDEENPVLKEAKTKKDYSAFFDLIEGDQGFSVSRKELRKKVIKVLSQYQGKSEIHDSLLELSALPDGKGHRIVTTNFDRLFFEAKKDLTADIAPKLAPPRKNTWKNLIFLHGVIDKENDPGGENLTLTRRDFGLAYLYDQWASRFVIQLLQDWNILFIGYSVDDPVMNYLVSAISYEKQRKKQSLTTNSLSDSQQEKNKNKPPPSIYAFAGYKNKQEEQEAENRWKSLGIEPILYEIKNEQDHSLLYGTIKKWAEIKRTGLSGKKLFLKDKLKISYKAETDRETAETVISMLKTDRTLAEYLPQINCSTEPEEQKPVDISWLKAFDSDWTEAPLSYNQRRQNAWKQDPDSDYGLSSGGGHLKKLIRKKLIKKNGNQGNISLWEPLSCFETAVAQWLCAHLDKKELIHWIIDQGSFRNGLISLHPDFKYLIQLNLKEAIRRNKKFGKRRVLFWKLLLMQKDQPDRSVFFDMDFLIDDLNQSYCPIKVQRLLSCLKPQIGFEKSFHYKKFAPEGNDQIYRAKLTINAEDYPSLLKNKTVLLKHAEDFSDLLKKAMESAEFSGIIQNGEDLSYRHRPSIALHSQNTNYYSWTYLIDLTRDSFDLTVKEDKKTALLLLHKWRLYPYSLFYRLILYAVTKRSELEENTALDLFKNNKSVLWSLSCQNEVLRYLSDRRHSAEAEKILIPLIMKGPDRSLYRENIDDNDFTGCKERAIYKRLKRLKDSNIRLPENTEKEYNRIKSKHKMSEKKDDSDNFPFFHTEAKILGSEKRYCSMTNEQIFEEIKYTRPNTFPDTTEKRAEFRSFFKGLPDGPERAFQILSMFKDNDLNSAPYWGAFIVEASMMTDAEQSKKYFLKSFEKTEKFSDDFFKKCLEALIYGFNAKGGLIYSQNKERFRKQWTRLWDLSVKDSSSDSSFAPSFEALNSHLGRLSESIFHALWSQKIPRDGNIPEDIREYFQIIIQEGTKEPSVFYHFGSYLWNLWLLDKQWVKENIKPLMRWDSKMNICKALWTGYLPRRKLGPNFLSDFKNEFFQLVLNRDKLYRTEDIYKDKYCESVADIFFIASGGEKITNIFTKDETAKLIQSMDTSILESLAEIIKNLLRDSGDKSAALWSEKIKPWVEKFWPPQKNLKTPRTAELLSFAILHCGDKLPEAFEFLKDKIEGVITKNYSYIGHYINKQAPPYVFNYPDELLQLLNWNFPGERIILPNDAEKLKEVLNKIKDKHPEAAQTADYKKLLDKLY